MLQEGVHIRESHHHFSYAHPLISYDKVGNRKTKVVGTETFNYTYDTLNRLINATNPIPSNPLESFTYDEVGNRVDSNQNGTSTFNAANQLEEDADFTYQYDANGNLIQKTDKATLESTVYEYDAENKLIRVASLDKTVNYKYDGLGRRIEKEVTETAVTNVTQYIYDNEDILLELDGSNNIVARYTHGPGIDEPLIMEKGDASFFYHADGLGSITELTDTAGTAVQSYTYSSFGKIESQLDPAFIQPYTFTAREFDPETGLYYYRARTYDFATGRFLQEDPLGYDGGDINFYAYVANNPQNWIDPTGELIDIIADIGFVGYDIYRLIADNIIGDCGNLATNLAALGADAAGIFVPFGTGFGAGVRAVRTAKRVNVAARGTKQYAKDVFRRQAGDETLKIIRDRQTRRIKGVRTDSGRVIYRPKGGKGGVIANVEAITDQGVRVNVHIRP